MAAYRNSLERGTIILNESANAAENSATGWGFSLAGTNCAFLIFKRQKQNICIDFR